MAKNKDERISYKLTDFFKENLKYENKKLYFGTGIYLSALCQLMKWNPKEIIKLLSLEEEGEILLSSNDIAEVCVSKGIEFEQIKSISEVNVISEITDLLATTKWPNAKTVQKVPVVTIMGHVDHGKTTLLDYIRKSHVAAKEVGGITQKIGAYQIDHKGEKITFIDTPGHEAFSKMRANGSKVTDVAIIVVSADDSVMPQTKESIEHAKAANVQMIVAINKVDKPGADIERVKKAVTDLGVMPEEWGGNVPFVPISGLTGQGVDKLLETILLMYKMKPVQVTTNINGCGAILESALNKLTGNVATLLVENGSLKVGDQIIIDDAVTKIKALTNDLGKRVDEAFPGDVVEIFGIGCSPDTGAKWVVISDEKEALKITSVIRDYKKMKKTRNIADISIEDLFSQDTSNMKVINIILKANGNGVLEAIENQVSNLGNEQIKVKVIRSDVGEITVSDLSLAEASKAVIYTFSLRLNEQIKRQADQKGIKILNFDIIYKLFEDIEEKLTTTKEKKMIEKETGRVEVKALFESSKFGTIAGCQVKGGKVTNKSIIVVMRKDKEIIKTKIDTLKHIKENVKDRKEGQECGLTLEGFNSYEVGDILIAYDLVQE